MVVYKQENKTLSSIVILYKNRILFQITRSHVLTLFLRIMGIINAHLQNCVYFSVK